VRRALSVAAFITALILLTGTPARVREIVLSHEAPSNDEYRVAAQ
jgi:hypothetical protein